MWHFSNGRGTVSDAATKTTHCPSLIAMLLPFRISKAGFTLIHTLFMIKAYPRLEHLTERTQQKTNIQTNKQDEIGCDLETLDIFFSLSLFLSLSLCPHRPLFPPCRVLDWPPSNMEQKRCDLMAIKCQIKLMDSNRPCSTMAKTQWIIVMEVMRS